MGAAILAADPYTDADGGDGDASALATDAGVLLTTDGGIQLVAG